MDSGSEEEVAPLKRRRKGSKTPVRNPLSHVITKKETKAPKQKKQTFLQLTPEKMHSKPISLQSTPPKVKIKQAQLGRLSANGSMGSPGRSSGASDSELSSSQEKQVFASSHNKVTGPFFAAVSNVSLKKYGLCPVCSIDLNFLHGVSANAHINQCLDMDIEFEKGYCSADSTCSLSNEKHFREYKHEPKNKFRVGTSEKIDADRIQVFEEKSSDDGELPDRSSSVYNENDPKLSSALEKGTSISVETSVKNTEDVGQSDMKSKNVGDLMPATEESPTTTKVESKKSQDIQTLASAHNPDSFKMKSAPSYSGSCSKTMKQTRIFSFFNGKRKAACVTHKSPGKASQFVDTKEISDLTTINTNIPTKTTHKPTKTTHKPTNKNTNSSSERSSGKIATSHSKTSTELSQPTSSKTTRRQKVQNQKKECPFYKKIPDTCFTVDAFCYGEVPGCKAYFLSHFHSDHYKGLSKNFKGKVYCSQVTANLVSTQLRVDMQSIVVLPMHEETMVHDVEVTLLDANHCPGSVMFVFQLKSGERVLHVGDFRADDSMFSHSCLSRRVINTLYLDTTYCDPAYTFPPQGEVVSFVVSTARRFLEHHPNSLIACGAYTIGKERVFKSIAISLGLKIGVTKQKWKVLSCLEDDELTNMLTTSYDQAQLHVLPLGCFNNKKLNEHLSQHTANGFRHLLAFKPTGWTFSSKITLVKDIKPYVSGSVTLYAVPYSEHSSFLELQNFVKRLRPLKIIPTVNIGSQKSRDAMNEHFRSWLK